MEPTTYTRKREREETGDMEYAPVPHPVASHIVALQDFGLLKFTQTCCELGTGARALITSTAFTDGLLLPSIGFVTAMPLRDNNWELAHVYTKPEERRKGHALALVQYALECIYKQTPNAIVWVEASSAPGENVNNVKRFLRKMGFGRPSEPLTFQKLVRLRLVPLKNVLQLTSRRWRAQRGPK